MKYLIILGDGMADNPIDKLNGKTPLDVANKPNIDYLSANGELGCVQTVPDGFSPGSDVANLSVLGYSPKKYYTGRSPLEAVSIGVPMQDNDVTLRANLVTLSDEAGYADKTLIDYSADEITSEEGKILMQALQDELGNEFFSLFAGISYRNLMLWHNGTVIDDLTPPHDISGKVIGKYLPKSKLLLDIMIKSYKLLSSHPINKKRAENGLNPANSIWLWGAGTKPKLDSFESKFGVRASVISAVDLIRGIAISANMQNVIVEGATGNIHTNFDGKAQAGIAEFERGQELVYIHIEAPDECGHRFELENKIKAIELIDQKIVSPLLNYLKNCGDDYKIMVLPDHQTPVELGTHTSEPVPYLIYSSNSKSGSGKKYCEVEAVNGFNGEGYELMKHFFE